MRSRIFLLIFLGFLVVMLSACSLSLAEDIAPPENYQPPTQAQVVEIGPTYPLIAPDPAAGAAIYAEKCAACHGATGLADGPMAANLPAPAPAFANPEVARAGVPAEWFKAITNGNLQALMPPFGETLSNRQRWDVLAYSLTLGTNTEELALGKRVVERDCPECLTSSGKQFFTDLQKFSERSLAGIYVLITEGSTGVEVIPPFAASLPENEAWAAAVYLRSLAFAEAAQPAAIATTNPTEAAGTPAAQATVATDSPPAAAEGVVTGKVTNGSGGMVPPGLKVTLHIVDSMQSFTQVQSTVHDDGTYRFEDVPMPAGRMFLVVVEFDGAPFSSDAARVPEGGQPAGEPIDLPVTIFAPSRDTSVLVVDRMHVFFDFSRSDVVQVIELYLISNPTESVVVGASAGQPVISFTLPEGALNLQFEDASASQRFIQTPGGFGDTQPVMPGMGQHQVLFAYDLPYDRKITLTHPVPLKVNAVSVMVPDVGVKLQANGFVDQGPQTMQGAQFELYNGGGLEAGESLNLTLSGNPKVSVVQVQSESSIGLIIGGGVLIVAIILAGVWIFRNRQQKTAPQAEDEVEETLSVEDDPDILIDAIAALDDQYQAGNIPQEAYHNRRLELKARLKELLAK